MEEKQQDYVRHYTTVECLKLILKGERLKFSSSREKWDDKNDRFTVELYEHESGDKIATLCFCDGIGNAHHWLYFGSSQNLKTTKDSHIGCNIRFKKEKIEQLIKEQFENDYLPYSGKVLVPMQYYAKKDVKESSIQIGDLPFLKRSEYKVEKELRVAIICHETREYFLNFTLEDIEEITLLLSPTESQYETTIHEICQLVPECKRDLLKEKFNYSGVTSSEEWQDIVKEKISQNISLN